MKTDVLLWLLLFIGSLPWLLKVPPKSTDDFGQR